MWISTSIKGWRTFECLPPTVHQISKTLDAIGSLLRVTANDAQGERKNDAKSQNADAARGQTADAAKANSCCVRCRTPILGTVDDKDVKRRMYPCSTPSFLDSSRKSPMRYVCYPCAFPAERGEADPKAVEVEEEYDPSDPGL